MSGPVAAGTVLLDRYRVIRKLGAGGMGMVYEVEHTAMGTHHAAKLLHGDPDQPSAQRQAHEDRFLREARLCARIRHPNLVLVTDFGIVDGQPVLVMDYVEGEDLEHTLRRTGPLPESEALVVIATVADALATVHAEGVVHRDLKPANLMRERRTGRIVLMDLGIAKDLGDSGATIGVVGTPAFMSPEQARDSALVAPVSDVYSLGATLVALLTAAPPARGGNPISVIQKVQQAVFSSGSILGLVPDLEAKVAPATVDLIRDMTRYRTEERLADAGAVLDRLEAMGIAPGGMRPPSTADDPTLAVGADGTPVPMSTPRPPSSRRQTARTPLPAAVAEPASTGATPLPPTAPPRRSGLALVVGSVAVVALAGVVGGALVLGRSAPTPVVPANRVVAATAATPAAAVAPVDPPPPPEAPVPGSEVWPGPTRLVLAVDGAPCPLVLVAPGRTLLGSEAADRPMERPRREVRFTAPFLIGETEVTRELYARFLGDDHAAHDPGDGQFERREGAFVPTGDGRLPVAGVTLPDARAFCAWLSGRLAVEVRLPGEAEWEYAARGPQAPLWPWGDQWRPGRAQADGREGPAPVGSFPTGKSWCGAMDMAGNLFEWCDDWWDEERWRTLPASDPAPDPSPEAAGLSVVRGGAYANPRDLCRSAFRIGARHTLRQPAVGFRIRVAADPRLITAAIPDPPRTPTP